MPRLRGCCSGGKYGPDGKHSRGCHKAAPAVEALEPAPAFVDLDELSELAETPRQAEVERLTARVAELEDHPRGCSCTICTG